MSPDTLAVHAGRDDLRALGVHAPPLDLSTTYPFESLGSAVGSLDAMMAGSAPTAEGGAVYSRLHAPTVARFETGLAALERTDTSVAFASGMAAITAVVLATAMPPAGGGPGKRHVVGVRPIYGTTDKLLSSGLLGTTVTWTDEAGVADAVTPETGLVCIETPVNPTLDLLDIAAVVEAAGGPDGVPVMVDSTFATPVLQQPARHGAAFSMHSGTKFIGGHGDVLAGVVACSEAWAARLRVVRILTGAVVHPLAAYLLHRGLPTLPLRVRRAEETATVLAERLAGHARIGRVYHPSRPGRDLRGLVGEGRQMSGPGPMLAFELLGPDGQATGDGAFRAADAFLQALRIATPAVSLGSTDTLAQHPAGLTQRVQTGVLGAVTEGLVRVSVGLEDADDLWDDLAAALGAAGGA